MSDYTPTENGVRNRYYWWEMSVERQKIRGERTDVEVFEEFDRFIRGVKAAAWNEGALAQARSYGMQVDAGENPYE